VLRGTSGAWRSRRTARLSLPRLRWRCALAAP